MRTNLLAMLLSLTAACASAPSPIESYIAEAAAGEVTIVEFVDYRCTHCQTMFDVMAPLLDMNEGRVHLVIRQVPLEKHHGAREAAEVAICAEQQGKLAPMHRALMEGARLGDDGVLTLAQHAGINIESFKDCLRSDLPKQRLAEDLEAWEQSGGDGLPMIFIGRQKFVGVVDIAPLETAFKSELP